MDGYNFSVPSGWNFQQTIDAIVQAENAVAEFQGFTAAELQSPMQSRELHAATPHDALTKLRYLAPVGAIRNYDVELLPSLYRLRVRS